MELIKEIYEEAVALGACDKITGDEDLKGIIKLLFSPQGREFCIKNQFPSLDEFRRFKKYHPERYGVYIDAGDIIIDEPENVFIIGDTTAHINISKGGHRVCVMFGATANVMASGYSVVKVERDIDSASSVRRFEKAISL